MRHCLSARAWRAVSPISILALFDELEKEAPRSQLKKEGEELECLGLDMGFV